MVSMNLSYSADTSSTTTTNKGEEMDSRKKTIDPQQQQQQQSSVISGTTDRSSVLSCGERREAAARISTPTPTPTPNRDSDSTTTTTTRSTPYHNNNTTTTTTPTPDTTKTSPSTATAAVVANATAGPPPTRTGNRFLLRRSSTISSASSSHLSGAVDRRSLLFPIHEISFKSLSGSESNGNGGGTSDNEQVVVVPPPNLLASAAADYSSLVSESVGRFDIDDDVDVDDCSSIPTHQTGSFRNTFHGGLRSSFDSAVMEEAARRGDADGGVPNKSDKRECADCGGDHARRRCANPRCRAALCRPCGTKWVLPDSSSDGGRRDGGSSSRTAFAAYCRGCFEGLSGTNLDVAWETVDPLDGFDVNDHGGGGVGVGVDTTIVFAHRRGSSRASFRPHARYLADEYAYRSILVDHPGHGSRADEDCTVANCANAVREALDAHGLLNNNNHNNNNKHNKHSSSSNNNNNHRTFLAASSSWGARVACRVVDGLRNEIEFTGLLLDSCDKVAEVPFAESLGRRVWDRAVESLGWSPLARARWTYASSFDDAVRPAGVFFPHRCDNVDGGVDASRVTCPVLFLDGGNGNGNGNGRSSAILGNDGGDGARRRRRRRRRQRLVDALPRRRDCKQVTFEGADRSVAHDARFFRSWVEVAASFVHHVDNEHERERRPYERDEQEEEEGTAP